MIEYLSIIAIGLSAFAIYYARDIAEKVKGRFLSSKTKRRNLSTSFRISRRKSRRESMN